MSGYTVYKHTSPSGKAYIGQTKNLKQRNSAHRRTESCRAFAHAISKYGWDNFMHEVLKNDLTLEEANFWEEHYIKEHKTLSPHGYNLWSGGGNKVSSEETRAKISASNRNRSAETREKLAYASRNRSAETRAKLSASNKGKIRTKEFKDNVAEYMRNRVVSDVTKARLSEAKRNQSKETREKLSAAKKGTTHSIETREKLAAANRGKKQSEETKKKRAAAMIGKILSDETRKRISESHKRRWQDKNVIASARRGAEHARSKKYVVTFPNGEEEHIVGLRHFCRENGLDPSYMGAVANKKAERYKGFKCRHADVEDDLKAQIAERDRRKKIIP